MAFLADVQLVKINQYPNAEYIGRPSPLGNPFIIGQHGTRNEVCDEYDEWFRSQIEANHPIVKAELVRLYRLMKQQPVLLLGCYCGESIRCHGRTIRDFLKSNPELLEIWEMETISYGRVF